MTTKLLLEYSLVTQAGLTFLVLGIMRWRKAHRIFPQLVLLLIALAVNCVVALPLLYFRKVLHLSIERAYLVYYVSTWGYIGASLILRILAVYSVFAEAMRPMAGLREAGKIIFRWVTVVSGLVSLALVAGPGVFSSASDLAVMFSHLQQGVNVLTLCLLVFVCFTARPLGLTYRSHLFGVSLGLGVTSVVEIVLAAWQTTNQGASLYSPVYLFSSLGICVALVIWGAYFAAPEPARRMILLPTTSPFFFWNRISEILGDSPGHVAVAGFTPSMLAPAEIEMLTAATAGDVEATHAELPEPPRPIERETLRRPDLGHTVRPSLAL